MLFDPRLCDASRRVSNDQALRAWGLRVGLMARESIWISSHLPEFTRNSANRAQTILGFFGADNSTHVFRIDPVHWLHISEAQATRALARLLSAGGAPRILAFLRALSSDIAWPAAITKIKVEAEVRAGNGRIDLLVTGEADDQVWGAVVEAKFGHHLKGNPLPAYAKLGKQRGLSFQSDAHQAPTGVLLVIGESNCRSTRSRLNRNKNWRFTHWTSFLRRFEREMWGLPDDNDFRQFRRTLWERTL